jgi:hypothetical protein
MMRQLFYLVTLAHNRSVMLTWAFFAKPPVKLPATATVVWGDRGHVSYFFFLDSISQPQDDEATVLLCNIGT